MEVIEGLVGYGSIGAVGMVVEDLQPAQSYKVNDAVFDAVWNDAEPAE